MSGLLAGKVWQSNLDGTLKPLAACLADIANDDGTRIFPSVEYTCWLTGKSARAVQYQLRALELKGILEVVSEPTGRAGEFKEYQMIESKLPKRKSWKQFKAGAKSAPGQLGAKNAEPGATLAEPGAKSCTPPYIDPSLDPSLTVHAGGQSKKPRQPGSDDEINEQIPVYHYKELKDTAVFGYDMGVVMAEIIGTPFTAQAVMEWYPKWWGSRNVNRGIGKPRPRAKSTLPEYAQDFENFLRAVVDRQQTGANNGQRYETASERNVRNIRQSLEYLDSGGLQEDGGEADPESETLLLATSLEQ